MFFLPVGMWAYPFEYVGLFVWRPKPMKPEEFNKKKQELAQQVESLMKKGKELFEVKE